ncbi:MAG TPA: hypothetical protein VI729_01780 [Anaerolineales bacterium]|nr:hypothetical protein [Anaerolineales bacterium]
MITNWVREIVEESGFPGATLKIGAVVQHPDGRKVKITGGAFWGTYGVSNFWYWRPILANGELGPEEHGYGWDPNGRAVL